MGLITFGIETSFFGSSFCSKWFSFSKNESFIGPIFLVLCTYHTVILVLIGAEKVPGAPGRRGKLILTRGNFVIPDKGTGIFS